MICKICENQSEKIFEKVVLQKYNVGYYKCNFCSFVQTDEPFWLKEAYESAITSLDIGLLMRNNYLQKQLDIIIDCCFSESKIMIDYAGGYGAFVRLMRDIGYDFYREDIYCENLFAKYFDITDIDTKKFDIVTAFEVLEHFNNPLEDIKKVFDFADNAIFSTELIPETNQKIEEWHYICQETGQHIAFYSPEAMQIIAKKFNKNYYYKKGVVQLHIFTAKTLTKNQIDYAINDIKIKKETWFFGLIKRKTIKLFNPTFRESLLNNDTKYIKEIDSKI